jgi:hypothetical protein
MAIVLIFPALMLLTLAGVSILALDKPQIDEIAAPAIDTVEELEYKLAA